MKTTLKTTIALALISLIIGCGDQEPEHTRDWKTELYLAGAAVTREREWLKIAEDPGEVATQQADYQEAMRAGREMIERAVSEGVDRSVAERWLERGVDADFDREMIDTVLEMRKKNRDLDEYLESRGIR